MTPAEKHGVQLHRRRADNVTAAASGDNSERQLARLALDIHDGPMQELVAVGWSVSDMRAKIDERVADRAFLQEEFDELNLGLERVEHGLRTMIRSLGERPSVPADESAILDAHVAAFKERCPDVAVSVHVIGEISLETDSQRIALDRVLREALTNIAKHAQARNVTIWLHGLRSAVLVQIRDDGRGFETRPAAGGDRMGIRGMEQRLELIGGKLFVTSSPGGPTVVSARIEKWRPAEND